MHNIKMSVIPSLIHCYTKYAENALLYFKYATITKQLEFIF